MAKSGGFCNPGELHLRQSRQKLPQNGLDEKSGSLYFSTVPNQRTLDVRVPGGILQRNEHRCFSATEFHDQRGEFWRHHIYAEQITRASVCSQDPVLNTSLRGRDRSI